MGIPKIWVVNIRSHRVGKVLLWVLPGVGGQMPGGNRGIVTYFRIVDQRI